MRYALVFLAGLAMGANGQTAAPANQPQIIFKFERPVAGVPVPRYSIRMRDDGTGDYQAEMVAASAPPQVLDTASSEPPLPATRPVTRKLLFGPATLHTAFDALGQLRSSHAPCDAHLKNIADTGTKTLEYRDANGEGNCSYNYSENKGVVQLAELFQGIELTLEAGRALEFKHRFDRLGLDAEMISLATNVESGRATALETIVSTLKSIAADTELIERVRLRAAKLVERATNAR